MSDAVPVTRLKMKCLAVELSGGTNPSRKYTLTPVYGDSPENKIWSKWTPSGGLYFTVTNPDCPDLKLDGEYFVDLTEVPAPAPPEASPST